jgi:hypothetical protein
MDKRSIGPLATPWNQPGPQVVPWWYIDGQRRFYRVQPNRGGTSRTAVGAPGGTITGTVSNTTDNTEMPFQAITSVATTGSVAGGNPLANGATGGDTQLAYLPWSILTFKTPATVTVARFWVGWTSAAITGSSSPTSACAAIRYATDIPDSQWVAYTANGSAATTSQNIFTFAASTAYILGLRATSSSEVQFWMGNTWSNFRHVHTSTATLPSSTTALYSVLHVTTLENVAKAISFGGLTTVHT